MKRALLLIFLGALVLTAEGQETTPGVGLPGVPRPDFSRYWCEERRPPDRPATCTSLAPAGFNCQVCPSTGWQGAYAELAPATERMLRRCWELDTWGTRQTHRGVFTEAEFSWAVLTLGKGHAYYRTCWWPWEVGGQHNPILIGPATEPFHEYRHECMVAKGAWPPPGEVGSYIGLDPVSRVDVCTNRFVSDTVRPVWPVYVRNSLPEDHPWNQGAELPPPTPPPSPPPAPACTPWPESEWLAQCRKLAKSKPTLDLAGVCEWCEPRGKAGTHLARLREGVCEPVVCLEPPPPPTCEECAALGFFHEACTPCPCPVELLDPVGHVHDPLPGRFCTPGPFVEACSRFRVVVTPEIVTVPPYVPGIESTGRLTLELVPVEGGPCP